MTKMQINSVLLALTALTLLQRCGPAQRKKEGKAIWPV